jgi:CubicO group peptidase (beta-lactamase class C family)
MKSLIYIFLTWFVSPCFSQTDNTLINPNQDSIIAHTRVLVQREFSKQNYPGLAVTVWQEGELLWSEGFGYASIEDSVKVDPGSSLFRIGSVSKTLTATGLAKLVERKALDLDEPVQKYVVDFPEKPWPITTRQVAQHTAGIRHYAGLEFYSNVHYASVRDALNVFMHDTLLFMPGEKFSYSSYGWNLVSAAMEGASGSPFPEFMQTEVFVPAKMFDTYPDDVRLTHLPRVSFYNFLSGNNIIAPQVDNSIKWAGGGFLSTAEDLIRFGVAILNHDLVDESTTKLFWTTATLPSGQVTNYGIGWATNTDKRDRRWVGHSGGSVGGSSMFLVYPEEELIVVTLVNRSGANAQELGFTIADQFLGK